jgi:hypothetical protein
VTSRCPGCSGLLEIDADCIGDTPEAVLDSIATIPMADKEENEGFDRRIAALPTSTVR